MKWTPVFGPLVKVDLGFSFEKLGNGETKVRISGWHDAFPAYEILINGDVVAEYRPTDAGPTPLNMGGAYTVNVASEVIILPPDRRGEQ